MTPRSQSELTDLAVAADGSVIVVGSTRTGIFGPPLGDWDVIVQQLDSEGTATWSRQVGSSENDYATGVAVDAAGDTYVSGYTFGSIGATNAGKIDAVVIGFEADGTNKIAIQIGSPESDDATGIVVGSEGEVYVSGQMLLPSANPIPSFRQAYVGRFDATGAETWLSPFGRTSFERSEGLASDGDGNLYSVGFSFNGVDANSSDATFAKLDADGAVLWRQVFGTTSLDQATSVAVGFDGSVFVAGNTHGEMAAPAKGNGDAFVARFDASGNNVWTLQHGTHDRDLVYDVATDAIGNVYIAGETRQVSSSGTATDSHAYLAAFSPSGELLWDFRPDFTAYRDAFLAVALDGAGNLYSTGARNGFVSSTLNESFIVKLYSYDFDANGRIDTADINSLRSAVEQKSHDLRFDFTADGSVDEADLRSFVTDPVYIGVPLGDLDLNGQFNDLDLLARRDSGTYEQANMPAVWEEGDTNGDGHHTSEDLVASFQDGGFESDLRSQNATRFDPVTLRPRAAVQQAGFSLLYDPATGNLSLHSPDGVHATIVQLNSGDGLLEDPLQADMSGEFDVFRAEKIVKVVPSGFGSFDFGSVLPVGLTGDQLLADLSLNGAIVGGGNLSISGLDPVLVHPDFALPGDFNGDWIVDAGDYTTWRDHLGSTHQLSGNGVDDGIVDQRDYELWREHFGEARWMGLQATELVSPVPAPSSFGIAAMSSLMLSWLWLPRNRVLGPEFR